MLHYLLIIFDPHDAIYFVKCTSLSCSKAPPQHDAVTPVLQGMDGVLRLVSLPLFPPNIMMVIMAKQFYFCFIRPQEISPNSTIFVPMCSCKPQSGFLWRFWSSGFFLAEWPFRLCRYRTRFTVDIDTCFFQHLHKVICCCSGIDLHISHQSTFIHRRQNASPS